MEVAYKTPYKILEMTYFPAYIRAYQCVTVRNDSPYKSLKIWSMPQEETVDCSVSGGGNNAHLLAEMLKRRAGLNLNAVPFRGGVGHDGFAWWKCRYDNRG
jgi:tripartite-type tricarboxylate transporter receptor subunit TctC